MFCRVCGFWVRARNTYRTSRLTQVPEVPGRDVKSLTEVTEVTEVPCIVAGAQNTQKFRAGISMLYPYPGTNCGTDEQDSQKFRVRV